MLNTFTYTLGSVDLGEHGLKNIIVLRTILVILDFHFAQVHKFIHDNLNCKGCFQQNLHVIIQHLQLCQKTPGLILQHYQMSVLDSLNPFQFRGALHKMLCLVLDGLSSSSKIIQLHRNSFTHVVVCFKSNTRMTAKETTGWFVYNFKLPSSLDLHPP